MKFSKRNLLIAVMIAVILFLLVRRGVSLASDMAAPASPVPANCNPVAVDAMISCATMYPSFPLVGDMTEGGKKKYCCKSS